MKTLESAAVLQSIVERISRITPDRAARWGRMNAHQMLCHLTDSYQVPMGGKKTGMATGILQRTVMKYVALHVPLQWPKGIATMPEIDQLVGGTPPAQFEADRAKLIDADPPLRRAATRFCVDSASHIPGISADGNGCAGDICTPIITYGNSEVRHAKRDFPGGHL